MSTVYCLMLQSVVYLFCGIFSFISLFPQHSYIVNFLSMLVIVLSLAMIVIFRKEWLLAYKKFKLAVPFLRKRIYNEISTNLPGAVKVEEKYIDRIYRFLYLYDYIPALRALFEFSLKYMGRSVIYVKPLADFEGNDRLIAKVSSCKFNYDKFMKLKANWRISENYYKYKSLIIRM